MARMATTPVYACRKCGKAVYVTSLTTGRADPKAELLRSMMLNLGKIALCKDCRNAYNYYASQGRTDEFWLNPTTVIYNVIDKSNLDYYRRKG